MIYIEIHIKIRILSPTCDRAWIPPNPRDTCPACIPHVFRMYPACILITSEDTCISRVSRMSACIPHVSFISDTSLSVDAFEIHVHVSHYSMYLGCIPHVCCILITLADTCISHVSRMYLASQKRTSS